MRETTLNNYGVRELLCAMIELSAKDAQGPKEFVCKTEEYLSHKHYEDAVDFFRGEWFTLICDTLNLPADKIRNEALLQ